MTEAPTALEKGFREAFIGLMNGQLNNPRRRHLPCVLSVRVTNEVGIIQGCFQTFVTKVTDHVTEAAFSLATSVDESDIIDAFANLGISDQLDQIEQVLGKQERVTLTVELGLLPNPARTTASERQHIDRSADIQQ